MREDHYPTRRHARPCLITRKDPVIWGTAPAPEGVRQDALDAFEREGVLVLHDLFPEARITSAQQAFAKMRRGEAKLDPETVIREPGSGAVRSIFAVHRQDPAFAALAEDTRLRSLVEHILGGPAYVMQSRINAKPAFEGQGFDWHSDFETWHAEDGMPRMRALSLSLFLSDNSALNGPTLFIPGSHKVFLPCPGATPEQNHRQSLKHQTLGVPDRDSLARLAERHGIMAPHGPSGTAVLFDCNTLHGSPANITPWPRINLFLVFNACDNRLEQPFDASRRRPRFLAESAPTAFSHPQGADRTGFSGSGSCP